VVDANLAAAKVPGIGGEVFNVACQETTSVMDIVTGLNRLFGRDFKPEFAPARRGDVRKTMADISKMKKSLKVSPGVDFDSGLKMTFDWFRSK